MQKGSAHHVPIFFFTLGTVRTFSKIAGLCMSETLRGVPVFYKKLSAFHC